MDYVYYRQTEFECEACGDWLYRVWPSSLITCTNAGCTEDGEPLFLVGSDD